MNFTSIFSQILSVLILSTLMVLPVLAVDLGDAKSQGLVGETSSGYLAVVKTRADIDALVASINHQRKAHYEQIAKKNNISLEAVEARAGQKAIAKTTSGNYINNGGGWQKK